MRKTIFTCAFLMSVSAACAVVGVGCSGDDGGDDTTPDSATPDGSKDTGPGHDATADANKGDTGGNVDSGGDDDASDTGTPDTSTPDTGTPDTGVDGGADAAKDAATDAGHDSGTDSGPVDAGTDGTVLDSGIDSGLDAGLDSGLDSGLDTGILDAGTDTGADASDGSTNGFDNPVQIDVSSVLTANTVVTTTPLPTGLLLTSMDKTGWDFVTNSKAKQKDPGYVGLNDDAIFTAVAGVHPVVKLHWNNGVDQLNSRVVQDATPFTFPVTSANYTQVQIYGTSTEGSSSIHVVLTYSDATTSGGADLQIADWFNAATTDQFTLISGMNRIQNGITWDTRTIPGIFGSNVPPDPTKKVTAVTITNNGPGYYVFYGAVAY